MNMKIYGYTRSGNCDKVRLVADYLRLPYDWVEVDILKGGTRTAAFLAINPQGQVPVVAFPDGRCLAQSGAIMRYLAGGTPLLPDDPWARARIDEWMFWEANNHEFFVGGCIAHMTFLGRTRRRAIRCGSSAAIAPWTSWKTSWAAPTGSPAMQ